MIVNALGIVLSRRNLGEADRLSTLYTESLGKIAVRFVGVNKPLRKLKALSEPLVWGEYRLYLSQRSEIAKAVGGRIVSSFPQLRGDLSRTVEALAFCELISHLTPQRSPNAGKYRLISEALQVLEEGPSPWLDIAYGLRLLELSGFGVRDIAISLAERGLWEALHSVPLGELGRLPWEPGDAERFRSLLYGHAEAQAGRPLKSRGFLGRLRGPSAGVRVETPC